MINYLMIFVNFFTSMVTPILIVLVKIDWFGKREAFDDKEKSIIRSHVKMRVYHVAGIWGPRYQNNDLRNHSDLCDFKLFSLMRTNY